MPQLFISKPQLEILKRYRVLNATSLAKINRRIKSGIAALDTNSEFGQTVYQQLTAVISKTDIDELDLCLESILGDMDWE